MCFYDNRIAPAGQHMRGEIDRHLAAPGETYVIGGGRHPPVHVEHGSDIASRSQHVWEVWISADRVLLATNDVLNRKFAPLDGVMLNHRAIR